MASSDIDLFHTVAIVKVPPQISFGFDAGDTDILFSSGLDHFNFRELSRGTSFGRIRQGVGVGLEVVDEQGRDLSNRYFAVEDGELRLKMPVMPSMLTRDQRVIRQDCLCYLMERYDDRLQSLS